MYTVKFTTIYKKTKKKEVQQFVLGEVDTDEYNETMNEIADTLYDMDLEYNDIDGDGDMAVDDMLISISEEEEFERRMQGRGCDYVICGSLKA